jgi:hypothetical protein
LSAKHAALTPSYTAVTGDFFASIKSAKSLEEECIDYIFCKTLYQLILLHGIKNHNMAACNETNMG